MVVVMALQTMFINKINTVIGMVVPSVGINDTKNFGDNETKDDELGDIMGSLII